MAKTVEQRIADLERDTAPARGAEGIALRWADGTPYNAESAALLEHWRRIGYTPRKVALTWPTHDIETLVAVAKQLHHVTVSRVRLRNYANSF